MYEDEISINIPHKDIDAIDHLNNDHMIAFNTIMAVVEGRESALFFIDGPRGTGKTYLYRTLLEKLRRMSHIVLATTSSGIAANLLSSGRTAHSRFKIPLNVDASSMCSISKQSALARLIQDSTAIIWDEVPMTHRHVFKALDRTFRDIMDVELPFGGKIMIFCGDFRQVLPVIPKGTRSELIQASIVKATFWVQTKILRLRQNRRSINDHQFAEFLLRVGDGSEQVINEEIRRLPECMVVPWESDQSINQIIDEVFPNLGDHVDDARYMVDRALITLINDDVDVLNEKIINMFSGEEITLYSFDSVEDDMRNLYQPEFLYSITAGGLPPHKLTFKVGASIMLLRNIDPKLGLCNGTRLLCRGSYQNLIDPEILTGQFAGTRVFLPRIPLKSAENAGLPFQLTRKQFPVKLSFSLTINKSQGMVETEALGDVFPYFHVVEA
ncbi:ATP-dependent DNA helicase PIF1-like [Rosa chinensis]|uniref:ATP-dependent DNA helicase PIF1-like n=1 Tax=Rosa chinensis TaxID=74649 RepID=UPI000D091A04|nr:ATP-dependent DNA helicase PIF1-like [Rosa chinensis]